MKILHTSDWHLGHTLYNYDRTEEQQAMLEQMVGIVQTHQPDVFLLCGDVYHTPQPSAAIQTMLTDAMVRIHEACPQMTIVMTAGNHDSGSKHEIFRTPWRALKVYAIGQLERDNIDEHIIEVPGKGFVIAVPYANERNIPEGFFQQLLDRTAERNTDGLPVVLTAHTTVKGCDFTGHDHATEYTVGGIDSLDLEQIGEGYDYLALGHIHHEQFVHSTRHHSVRYCGTPLPVSFDESFPHSISMVEIDKHGDTPIVEKIEIINPHPLVTLPTEGMASWDEAKEYLRKFPDDIPAYIRLNVEIDDFLPTEANAEASQLTKDKKCRFCLINAKRKNISKSEAKILTVQEFQEENPLEIARNYAEFTGKVFDEEMAEMFKEIMDKVADDSRKGE
ncbi:MAG: exonuclease SbcCD subunit D [Bacteroidales bacterium]|nr:exonuclease SbcCD subunit D [Bacteroidales bacterium]